MSSPESAIRPDSGVPSLSLPRSRCPCQSHLGRTAAPPHVAGAALDVAVRAARCSPATRYVHKRGHEPGHSHLQVPASISKFNFIGLWAASACAS